MKHPSLCESLEALQPTLDALLAIERDAAGVEAQMSAIPANVRLGRGESPEMLLDQAQGRIDARYWALLGCEPMLGFVSPESMKKIREILKHLRRMRKAGAGPEKIARRVGLSEFAIRELLSGREIPGTDLGPTRETDAPEQVVTDGDDATR